MLRHLHLSPARATSPRREELAEVLDMYLALCHMYLALCAIYHTPLPPIYYTATAQHPRPIHTYTAPSCAHGRRDSGRC